MTTKWKNCHKGLAEGKEELEEQLVLWDQIQSGKEEVSAWLHDTVERLEVCTAHFGDTANVQSTLTKYKVRKPHIFVMLLL